jgi:hypothetical protein
MDATPSQTPAQRLARVFRMLAVLADLRLFGSTTRAAARYASVSTATADCAALNTAERHATEACRLAGIDPESIR